MPALASISVNDAEATPVAHVFAPVTTDGSLARLANRSGDTPAGFETISVEVRTPQSATGAYRVILKGNFPTEATVDGSIAVVRNSSFELSLNFSQKSTAQERKNVMQILSGLLSHATIVAVAENVEPIY
jgi:hypothetical protein